MSNCYMQCFYRINFVVIPSYIELPCSNQALFSTCPKSQYKNVNILRMERAFKMK